MPLTVEEFELALLYTTARQSLEETGGGAGVEVKLNQPFDNIPLLDGKYTSGQYTYKIYHVAKKIPSFLSILIPHSYLKLHEESWNCYPYTNTILSNPPFMKERFHVQNESLHFAGSSTPYNVFGLSKEELKLRQVVDIDISDDVTTDYSEDKDPALFRSAKTGRGPLKKGTWQASTTPSMMVVKLIKCNLKWFGLQGRCEDLCVMSQKRMITMFHRQAFCWMDDWVDMTIADIREMEEKTRKELDENRERGELRGTTVSEMTG